MSPSKTRPYVEPLTIDEVATIYRLAPSTILRRLKKGHFHPRPSATDPYLWRAADVIRHYERRHKGVTLGIDELESEKGGR